MNSIAEEILSYLGVADDPELLHYGTPRHSGRYPWGSGENSYQRTADFLGRVENLRKQGFTFTDEKGKTWTGDTAIAKSMGLSTTQFRTELGLASDARRSLDVAQAKALKADGKGATEIGRIMGKSESTVRSLLNESSEARTNQARETAELLRKHMDEKGIIDIGPGVEKSLGISREKLNQAVYILEQEGAKTFTGGIPQATNQGKQINTKVLMPPGTKPSEFYAFTKGEVNISSIDDYVSYDDGKSFKKAFEYPASMDSKRLKIRYAEEGGIEKDGIVELRRGVEDLSLGDSRYAQVRIMVDGTHYIKGMAMYSDNMPDGVDVVFNTNKSSSVEKMSVLKKIKDDPDNPFGSRIKEHGGQSYYDDPNGKFIDEVTGKRQSLSLINKRADEGDWEDWANKVPSQFLSKQPLSLAKKQLDLAAADKYAEFDDICNLTNPTVKKTLLQSFSEDCDSAAVHLQAAALPRQKYQVIIPITSMKNNEVYAPNFEDGEKVALIRYPHGGTFEIPILTVNNKHKTARGLLGNAVDAVGINSKVAEQLSGADFDGDTVMVIPTAGNGKNLKVKIASTPKLKELEGFDPKMEYGGKPDGTFKRMRNTQNEMGKISNLITDMTLKGATQEELARAVKHSMVVIDAEKHGLDYKQSEADNGIAALRKKYQAHDDDDGYGGASTIISRAKSQQTVDKRQGQGKINTKYDKRGNENPWYDPNRPEGALIYETADDLYYTVTKTNKRTGEVTTTTKKRTQRSTKMAETDDAYTLVSKDKFPMEMLYADYANKMKALANDARKEILSTGKIEYSSSANKTYSKEVKSLLDQLTKAEMNAPKERQAQLIANAKVNAKKQSNPGMTKEEIKKASQQALTEARARVGAKRVNIVISDREWEAIQSGAISENRLSQILKNTDKDNLRKLATPRSNGTSLSSAQISRIKAMVAAGHSTTKIAEQFNISTSMVSKYAKGKE